MNSRSIIKKDSNKCNFVDAILVLSIASESVFFCTSSLLGYMYRGSESSSIYKVFLALLLIFNIGIFLFSTKKRTKLQIKYCLMITIPWYFCISATLTSLFYTESYFSAENMIIYILVWQTTAILAAININIRNNFICIVKYFDIVMLICTLGLLRAITNSNIVSSTIDSIGGATYQSASYYAAFAFGLNLFQLVANGKYTFKWLSFRIFKIARLVLLLIQLSMAMISGGRGGVVLIIIYILYFALVYNKQKIISKKKVFLVILIGIFTIFVSYPTIRDNQVFQLRFSRIFSYITMGGLDFSQTSGRDIIYRIFIDAISQKPILGRGIISYYYVFDTYPHNIFLEILFEGGLCYLILWTFIVVKLIRKIKISYHEEPEKTFMKMLALYPGVLLMFSGSYIINPLFWFVVAWAALK